jgi:hypothetical protein
MRLLGPGHEGPVGTAHSEAVLDLVGEHGPTQVALGLLPLGQVEVADAHVADDAVTLQLGHSLHRRAGRDDGVGPVHLVEVDQLDAEALRAGLAPLLDDGCQRHDGKDLGGEERLVAAAHDGLAHDPLGLAERVDLRGVDQVDAEIEGALGDGDGLGVGVLVPVAPLARAELPRAEPDGGETGPADLDVLHWTPISASSMDSLTWGASGGRRRA